MRMACAIFLQNDTLYRHAVDYYLHANDNGALPHYISETGQCQETGRDQGHVQLGLEALCQTAEMAWQYRNEDLWGAYDNRLLKGIEYTARYNLGYDVPLRHGKIVLVFIMNGLLLEQCHEVNYGTSTTSPISIFTTERDSG